MDTIEDKIAQIVGEARALILRRLDEEGVPHDSNTDDTVYADDTEEKRTFYVTLSINECNEYGGEA